MRHRRTPPSNRSNGRRPRPPEPAQRARELFRAAALVLALSAPVVLLLGGAASAQAATCANVNVAHGFSFSCDTDVFTGTDDQGGSSAFYLTFGTVAASSPAVGRPIPYTCSTSSIGTNELICSGSIPARTVVSGNVNLAGGGCRTAQLHVTFIDGSHGGPYSVRVCSRGATAPGFTKHKGHKHHKPCKHKGKLGCTRRNR